MQENFSEMAIHWFEYKRKATMRGYRFAFHTHAQTHKIHTRALKANPKGTTESETKTIKTADNPQIMKIYSDPKKRKKIVMINADTAGSIMPLHVYR